MQKFIWTIVFIMSALVLTKPTIAANENLSKRLSGRILLQVQSHGEAWYVNTANYKKYYLGRPADAFDVMRNLGTGITNNDLSKFEIGIIEYDDNDNDSDGLANRFEQALGTDSENPDTDGDGHNDGVEIKNNYNPNGSGFLPVDNNFAENHLGKIFLQTEQNGESWYINPADKKRYYLGRPADAFAIMRELSLGIADENLSQIATGYLDAEDSQGCPSCQTKDEAAQALEAAANAIMLGSNSAAMSYFTTEMQKAIEYTMNFLDQEGKFTLGNIMLGAELSSSTEAEKTYSTEVYFSMGGYKVPINFYVQKQEDGSWLLANL
ncbi:hypothetical protein KKC83_05125 [Patescibacteria group bacterium]|nr:hypothetical protein [Candidatus Falkowbacteria bacterium]MBU3906295.1 hypothetical protein [Patescibacteria group bacterium]MBU4015332.1 hypothetical protein [Patescibacteria group bacterium]MBU4026900.1 hypothetical protein [Patescibacteria group bacterium]MBU4072923.1 hypothetical protein [Patescibacteria group bacterium]